jgi:hypothetical protein
MSRLIDETNHVYGRLTVLSPACRCFVGRRCQKRHGGFAAAGLPALSCRVSEQQGLAVKAEECHVERALYQAE